MWSFRWAGDAQRTGGIASNGEPEPVRYVSTRGEAPPLGFAEATLAGLARDGGLYVPAALPQLDADINREKAKTEGIPLDNLFETMQIYLGSLYVNDFNRFGRTYEVIAQADSQFRAHAEDITRLKTPRDANDDWMYSI